MFGTHPHVFDDSSGVGPGCSHHFLYSLELPVPGPKILWIDAVSLAGDRVVQCLNDLGVSFKFMQAIMLQGHMETHVLARSLAFDFDIA